MVLSRHEEGFKMIDTVVVHPLTYLLVKLLTLIVIVAVYWFVATHPAKRHLPE